jgi:hypothetical protein
MGIKNPVAPTVEAVEPRDEVKIEIMSARGPTKQQWRYSKNRRHEDDDRSYVAMMPAKPKTAVVLNGHRSSQTD